MSNKSGYFHDSNTRILLSSISTFLNIVPKRLNLIQAISRRKWIPSRAFLVEHPNNRIFLIPNFLCHTHKHVLKNPTTIFMFHTSTNEKRTYPYPSDLTIFTKMPTSQTKKITTDPIFPSKKKAEKSTKLEAKAIFPIQANTKSRHFDIISTAHEPA